MPNGGVDRPARFHERIAGPVMMRNTLPPLASNDLFDGAGKRLLALQNNVECFQFVRLRATHYFGKDLVAIFRRDNNELIITGA
jgi:hypothetical protein